MRLGLCANVFHQAIIVAGPLLLLWMGEKKKEEEKIDFTFPIILATKTDFKRLSIKLDVYQVTIWCEN